MSRRRGLGDGLKDVHQWFAENWGDVSGSAEFLAHKVILYVEQKSVVIPVRSKKKKI